MRKHKILISIILFFLSCFSLKAWDFGILLDQNVDINNSHGIENAPKIDYSLALIPHFQLYLGDNKELYISAGVNYNIQNSFVVPELLRTDITMRFGFTEIKAGRMLYRDPLGMAAQGLFDGAQVSYAARFGTLNAGVWYTGLLYKERANITMTNDELHHSYRSVDYSNFQNTYFAPGRILSSLGWEHPSLAGLLDVRLAALGQFDMTGANLHSQYFMAKMAIPSRYFLFDVAGCYELIQDSGKLVSALAGEAGLTFMFPTALENHLTLRGRYASGVSNEIGIGAFLPLTTIHQGNLLKAKLSGLSVFSAQYKSRLHRAFYMDLEAACFVRNDLGTYDGYPVIGIDSNGFFLGTEFFAWTIWSLSSELQLNLGGGVFLPQLGNAAPDADLLWRTEIKLVFSIL
jgi:hypothetical protein